MHDELYEQDANPAQDAWAEDGDDWADEEEYHVREAAKAVLLPWYHAKACLPSQGCSCDIAREEYASMPTAGLTFAADMVRGLV